MHSARRRGKPIVLVVEDDYVDQHMLRRGLKERALDYTLHAAEDGQQALDLLRSDRFTTEQLENLVVFLDINMPGMNGHQFLDEIRKDKRLRRIIVFVLTTSDHPTDKMLAYDRNVAGYFVKRNLDALLDMVSTYIANVEFPPSGQRANLLPQR